jgi:PIN domain nuclease of toxin-antitoxin system
MNPQALRRRQLRLLLDTHIPAWAAETSPKLSRRARALIDDASNAVIVSVVSLREIRIKCSLGRVDFQIDPTALRALMLEPFPIRLKPL